MKMNVGVAEKVIRVIAGIVLIALAYTGTLGVWAYVGIVPLLTGLLGWCPLYSLLNINTSKTRPPERFRLAHGGFRAGDFYQTL